MRVPRRQFLSAGFRAVLAASLTGLGGRRIGAAPSREGPGLPSAEGRVDLALRFPDLKRHFLFDYYPWWGGPPDYVHWDALDRHPPTDLASAYMPKLGAYDVRSPAVLEQHARWIKESGAGAIALSWWGPGSWEDQRVSLVMDVMRDHDVKVTFGLEPYVNDRGERYAEDVLYLLREYGEKRRWDSFLLLRDASGAVGPVFKGFRCTLPLFTTDCLGRPQPVEDYTPDSVWRRQIDRLRHVLQGDFDHVTLLADALEFARARACGFDGIAIYDNFIPPEDYAGYAAGASGEGLVFSFNINPGYDQIEPRRVRPGPCPDSPRPFAPPTEGLDWSRPEGRELAARRSVERIRASFAATLDVQTDPALANDRRGFFLVYMNSFNEWHEGHQFEPMKDAAELTPAERAVGYHDPSRGDYRLRTLASLLPPLMERRPELPRRPLEALSAP